MTMNEAGDHVDVKVTPSVPKRKRVTDFAAPLDIVKRFAKRTACATAEADVEFYQLVSIWKQLNLWESDQIAAFIVQFFDDPEKFNIRTIDMVRAICDLKWHLIPAEVRPKFVEFICNVATVNPMHLNTVLRTCVRTCLKNFAPIKAETIDENEKQISDEEREDIFQRALSAIYLLIPVFSARVPMLLTQMEKNKLHKTAPVNEFLAYIRLSIVLSEKYQVMATDLWSFIIDSMLKLDSEVSHGTSWDRLNDVRQIFPKKEDAVLELHEELNTVAVREKLDACMITIFCYSSLESEHTHAIKPSDHEFTKWLTGWKAPPNFFGTLLLALDSQVLFVHEIENVPFIWFYMASIQSNLDDTLLEHLWQIVTTPARTPNDLKKLHSAVAFMAGILSRANYVDTKSASKWLHLMFEWCANYVKNAGQVKFRGGIQHSTFYATFEAALFVLCFRYKEFIDTQMTNEIRMWGITRVVHSQLEPLSFIARPLAMFFASISRYMQIVYCTHILNMTNGNSTVETYFPFLRVGLVETGKILQPMLRHFVPVEDDFDTIQTMRSRRTTEVTEPDDDEYDFMMVDDGIDVDDFDMDTSMM